MVERQEMVYVPGGTTTVMTGPTVMTPTPVILTGSPYVGAPGSTMVGQPAMIVGTAYPTTYWGGLRTGYWRTSAMGIKYVFGPILIIFGSIQILTTVITFSTFHGNSIIGIVMRILFLIIGVAFVIGGIRLIQMAKERLNVLNNQTETGGNNDPGYVYPPQGQQANQLQQNQQSPYLNQQILQTSYPPQYQMDPTQPPSIGFGGMPPQDSYPTKNPNSTEGNDMPPPYPSAGSSAPPYNPTYNP